jgi:uncharacterized coiled-coil DUF342 family protein
MPCKKCENEKWKWGENGECQYDSKEACEKANKDKKGYKSEKKEYSYVSPLGKNTHSEYVKECESLKLSKVHKIKLTLVEALQDAEIKLRKFMREGDELYSSSGAVINKVEDAISELDKMYKELDRVNAGILEFQNIIYGYTREAERIADELGIREEDLPGYKEADKAIQESDDRISDFDARLDVMENYIKG